MLHHILRRDNLTVDFLAKIVSSQEPMLPEVFINDTHEPSILTTRPPDPVLEVASHDQAVSTCLSHDLGADDPLDHMMVDQEVATSSQD